MPGIMAATQPKFKPANGEEAISVSAPSLVDPTTITGMVLWLQPSEVFMYDDDAGSLGIDLPAGGSASVGYWQDSSGAGNNFNQPTSAQRPVVYQGVQNGQNGVRFNGTTQHFRRDTFSAYVDGADAPFTWIVVFKDLSNALSGSGAFFAGASVLSDERYIYAYSSIFAGSSGFVKKSDDGVTASANMGFAPDSTQTKTLVIRCNGTTVDVWLNQDRKATAVSCNVNSISLTTFGIGAMIKNLANTFQFTGYMYEILAWDNAIADADVAAVQDYLSSKFGI